MNSNNIQATLDKIANDINTAVRLLKDSIIDQNNINFSLKEFSDTLIEFSKILSRDSIKNNISKDVEQAYLEISNFYEDIQRLSKEINQSINDFFRATDKTDKDLIFDQIKVELTAMTNLMKNIISSFDIFKNSSSDVIPPQLLEVSNKLIAQFAKLENIINNSLKINNHEELNSLTQYYNSLGDSVKSTADILEKNEKEIVKLTRSILDQKFSNDSGALLILNNLINSFDKLGQTVNNHKSELLEIFAQINGIKDLEDGNLETLNELLGDYFTGLREAEKAKKDLDKVLKDSHLNKDPELVHAKITKLLTINRENFETLKEALNEFEKIGKEDIGVKEYEKLNKMLKELGNNYNNAYQSATMANYVYTDENGQIDEEELETNEGLKRRKKDGFLRRGAKGLFTLPFKVIGKLASLGAEAGEELVKLAGLGGLLSMESILRGIFEKNRVYSNLEIQSALYDMTASGTSSWDRDTFDAAFARGLAIDENTHGYISTVEYMENRADLVKNVMGPYGSQNPNQDAREINSLAHFSILFQKGLGISKESMNSAIQTFYKELKLNITDTEYLLSKIAISASSFNVPFEKQLSMVTNIIMHYKEAGLSETVALNAVNNLMGKYNMSMADAQNVAMNIASGVSNMNEGMAAFSGMMFGGASTPFEAIMNYKNKWNPDGTVNKRWIKNTVKQVTGMADLYKEMAGGDPYVQQYLLYKFYKDELNMDEKTSVLLSQTQDPATIEKILLNSFDKKNENKEKVIADTMGKLSARIAEATKEMSGIDKTLNALSRNQLKVSALLDDHIEALTNFEDSIDHITNLLTSGDLIKRIDKLIESNKILKDIKEELEDSWLGELADYIEENGDEFLNDYLGLMAGVILASPLLKASKKGIDLIKKLKSGKKDGKDVKKGKKLFGSLLETITGDKKKKKNKKKKSKKSNKKDNEKENKSSSKKKKKKEKKKSKKSKKKKSKKNKKSSKSKSKKIPKKQKRGIVGKLFGVVGIITASAAIISGSVKDEHEKNQKNIKETHEKQTKESKKNVEHHKQKKEELNKLSNDTIPTHHKENKELQSDIKTLNLSAEKYLKSISGTLSSTSINISSMIARGAFNFDPSALVGGGGAVNSIAELISSNEGNYGSVNRNDNGTVSIGKFQWRGNRARDLLKQIYKADPQLYKSIVGNVGLRSLDKSWEGYTLTKKQAEAVSRLISTPLGVRIQQELMRKDLLTYIEHGRKLGITDLAALIYYADLENQGGQGGARRVVRNAKGKDLESLHRAALRDPKLGKYAERRNHVYREAIRLAQTGNLNTLLGVDIGGPSLDPLLLGADFGGPSVDPAVLKGVNVSKEKGKGYSGPPVDQQFRMINNTRHYFPSVLINSTNKNNYLGDFYNFIENYSSSNNVNPYEINSKDYDIYIDPPDGVDEEYLNALAKYIEKEVEEAYKEFSRKWNQMERLEY